jgi:hypothetical protein
MGKKHTWKTGAKSSNDPNDGKAIIEFTLLTERSQRSGNDTALNAIAFTRLQGRMLCESNVWGDLITNDRLFFSFHPTRIISQGNWGRKFLVPVWQLHDIVPITSRVAPEEPATTRRPTI